MLETEALILALIVIFLAGASQSLTGFGFGLIAIPLLTLFISPKLAPPIVLVDGLVLNLLILRFAYPAVQPRRMWVLALAGVLGVPVGIWILANWDVDSLRIYIGVMTCSAAFLFLRGFKQEVKREQLVSAPIGFFSGILSGSINMSGPPVILFFANQGLSREVFRANIIAYFVALQITALPLMVANGLLTTRTLTSGIVLLPGLFAGGWAGSLFADQVDDRMLRRLTLGIVSFAGIVSILKGSGLI